ncbi:casein kinase I isoform delta [Xylaria sp. CBS 124048]|nr:casein kinase I isoform delta [Xylaria sp. CBS 124048]
MDIIIHGHYRVDRKIGAGGFGLVYMGTDTRSGKQVALKLTHIRDDPVPLANEAETYEALAGAVGIPQVHWYGQECEYYVLVQELLGPSLEDLFNYCGRLFSLKTVLLIADQAIARLKAIHARGFLHRDIKPDNFVMGVGRRGNTVYAIDFGLAKEFSLAESHRLDRARTFGGTRRYASINNHNKHEQSFRDDMESLGYVFLYFLRGSLPWQGIKATTEGERDEMIKERKMRISAEALCRDLPDEFATYLNYTRSLRFEDKPDYAYLRRLFHRLFVSERFTYDYVFDWTEKRFYEMHGAD